MKIDLSIAITDEILNTFLKLNTRGEIPSVAKFGHIGTHFDVMDKQFSLENTRRNGKLFDVSHVQGREIGVTDIDASTINTGDFVLFYTGWLKEKQYGTAAYVKDHPELTNDLITLLVNKKVSMIGIDFAGIRKPAEHPQADQYCADHNVFVIENLANLDVLAQENTHKPFTMHTYPVNYQNLSGLPCRVVAEI